MKYAAGGLAVETAGLVKTFGKVRALGGMDLNPDDAVPAALASDNDLAGILVHVAAAWVVTAVAESCAPG